MSNKKTPFKNLANTFAKLEDTASNLAMIDILAEFLPRLSPEEVKITAYLLRGRIAPTYQDVPEFGMAQKMVLRALAESYGISGEKTKEQFEKTGDLGLVAESLAHSKKGSGLKIEEVFEGLKKIAYASGTGSQAQKLKYLEDLLVKSSPLEAKYIARTLIGSHRIGVAEMTFLSGLALGYTKDKKNKVKLETAYNVVSDLGEIAYKVASGGLKAIEKVEPEVGVPIRVMLAQRVQILEEVEKNIKGAMFVEYKYDGERVQIHIKKDGNVSMFSRRLEVITYQYPDIAKALLKSFNGKEAIIEGEVVAYNPKTGNLEPFQTLMQRRRKHDIEEYVKKIPVSCFLFDLLYLNGKSMLVEPLEKRKEALEKEFKTVEPTIRMGDYVFTPESTEAESYFYKATKEGAEGVIIKAALSTYNAGKRGWNWIKFKKDYQEELADSFDLVVIGALYGRGRRAGSYGSLLVASFDPEKNKYYSFTKVGAGLTDKDLEEIPQKLGPYKIKTKHRLVETEMEMDVWFEPAVVLELSGAEITISPTHTVAKDKIKKNPPAGREGGLALRFPRFLRWRKEKSPEQATTVEEIYQIYKKATKSK